MKKNKATYCLLHKASAVFMILALVWLTVSTPFIVSFKQEMAKMALMDSAPDAGLPVEEDNSNPLGNSTEEKTPSSPTSLTEEYLHHGESTHFFVSQRAIFYKCTNTDIYTAFHGELLVPPPNAA